MLLSGRNHHAQEGLDSEPEAMISSSAENEKLALKFIADGVAELENGPWRVSEIEGTVSGGIIFGGPVDSRL